MTFYGACLSVICDIKAAFLFNFFLQLRNTKMVLVALKLSSDP